VKARPELLEVELVPELDLTGSVTVGAVTCRRFSNDPRWCTRRDLAGAPGLCRRPELVLEACCEPDEELDDGGVVVAGAVVVVTVVVGALVEGGATVRCGTVLGGSVDWLGAIVEVVEVVLLGGVLLGVVEAGVVEVVVEVEVEVEVVEVDVAGAPATAAGGVTTEVTEPLAGGGEEVTRAWLAIVAPAVATT
jgi:hypothetical protein